MLSTAKTVECSSIIEMKGLNNRQLLNIVTSGDSDTETWKCFKEAQSKIR